MSDTKTNEPKPAAEKKPRKPRKARTYYLLCGTREQGWQSVAQGKALTEIRGYIPTDEQDGCHFIEVTQLGPAFVLRREQTTVRTPVK